MPLSWHHLVERSLGGDDVAENLVPLGGTGTMYCHGIYTSHHAGQDCKGARRTWDEIAAAIRVSLTPAETEYILAAKGPRFLDRYYPDKGGTDG